MPLPDPTNDTWTQADGEPWDPAIWTTIRNARGTSSPPTVLDGAGRMVTDGSPPDNCRIIASPPTVYTDTGITVSMKTTDADTVEVGFRVSTNVDSGVDLDDGYILSINPQVHPTPETIISIIRFNKIKSYDFVGQDFDDPHNDGVWRKYRVYSRGNRHRAKWWLASEPEPPLWNIDKFDNSYTSGRVFLGMWNNNGFFPPPATVDFDDFHIEEIQPPPPGIYAPDVLLDSLYVGDKSVIAAYQGNNPVDIP
jgi:hypothetical protein